MCDRSPTLRASSACPSPERAPAAHRVRDNASRNRHAAQANTLSSRKSRSTCRRVAACAPRGHLAAWRFRMMLACRGSAARYLASWRSLPVQPGRKPMPARFQLVIDCADPDRLARFWAAALDYELEPPPAGFPTWDDYYRDLGVPEEDLGVGADSISDPEGHGPRIWFQVVPETKAVKNRLRTASAYRAATSTPGMTTGSASRCARTATTTPGRSCSTRAPRNCGVASPSPGAGHWSASPRNSGSPTPRSPNISVVASSTSTLSSASTAPPGRTRPRPPGSPSPCCLYLYRAGAVSRTTRCPWAARLLPVPAFVALTASGPESLSHAASYGLVTCQ